MTLSNHEHRVTPRQKQILGLIGQGLTNKEIATRLSVAVPTIKQQLRFLYLKFGVANRTQLALRVAGIRTGTDGSRRLTPKGTEQDIVKIKAKGKHH